MNILPIGMPAGVVGKGTFHNPNFKSKVKEECLRSVIYSDSKENFSDLIQGVSGKISELEGVGGYGTLIEVGNRDVMVESLDNIRTEGVYETHYANYYFTNPILKDIKSHVKVLLGQLPSGRHYVERNDVSNITKDVVVSGESKLLLNYAEKLIEETKESAKPILVHASDIINRLEISNFSKEPIAKFKEYLKNIDAGRALDRTIAVIKSTF